MKKLNFKTEIKKVTVDKVFISSSEMLKKEKTNIFQLVLVNGKVEKILDERKNLEFVKKRQKVLEDIIKNNNNIHKIKKAYQALP